jgi:glycosyltransferase involved in cell wall biosynthesis
VAGAFILRLARALGDQGTEVRVLAPSGAGLPRDELLDGIPVRRFRYAPATWETLAYQGTMAEQVAGSLRGKLALTGMLGGGARAVWRETVEWQPAVVHAHWWFPSGLLATAAAVDRTPLVITLHGSDVRLARRSAWGPWLFRRVVRRGAAVTAVSEWLASEAHALSPGLAVEVAPMPVEVALFTPTGAPRQPNRLLFVGRLNAQKGLGDVLEALASCRQPVELDIVGDGPDRSKLGERATALGLADRVRWHGELRQRDIVPLYRAATAVVVPSRDEGLGLVAVEALLCETPVIAYRSGGLPDIIRDGETGWLVPPDDRPALASTVDRVIADPAEAALRARAGRARVLERFSPTAAARIYRALYRRVAPA